jgi:hypothetical protein
LTKSKGSANLDDPAYAYLELLTTSGWTILEKCYLGDGYYGLHTSQEQAVSRLKTYAEGLATIGANVSSCPPEVISRPLMYCASTPEGAAA